MTENTRLILTWFSNIQKDSKENPIVAMPFHANNVDVSVSANALYGISHSVINKLNNGSVFDYFQSSFHFQNLFLSTSQMISSVIDDGMLLSRPDIGK